MGGLLAAESAEGVAELVEQASLGDQRAVSTLMPIVYDELRRLAGAYMQRERPGQTIQPTALVHEAYLRLLKDKKKDWHGRTHFVAIAARSMRQILVERARSKATEKRGGARNRVTLDEAVGREYEPTVDLLAIDEALVRLAEFDPQQAGIVELRFFGGLTIEETAQAMDISPATVKRGWTVARAWLRREVRADEEREASGS